MLILGLNAFHADAAACVVRDGQLIAAAEEERFRRVKHWAGFPSEAAAWCLEEAGASLDDVDHLAINQDSRANVLQRLTSLATARPNVENVIDHIGLRRQRSDLVRHLEKALPGQSFNGQQHAVEHQMAHLSSAFYVSPFDKAVAVSVDGFGDFASTAWGVGDGGKLSVDKRVNFPHSLGVMYQAVTQFLGFPNFGDEYKVMALASHGKPDFLGDMRALIELKSDGRFELDMRYFRHDADTVLHQWDDSAPILGAVYSDALEKLLGPRRMADDPLEQRHKDIAASVQALYEEAFFHVIKAARRDSRLTDLVLAGGCANNAVANGKIRQATSYRRVYVQSAPGDQGGAIGAAFSVWHRLGGERSFQMDHAYWGPSYDQGACGAALKAKAQHIGKARCDVSAETDDLTLCRRTARAIAEGKVVGWFQGRMEWGPSALGARSILCDPRRAEMRDILDVKIEQRESFRPFSASVLEGYVGAWFDNDDDVPFMLQSFQIRADRRTDVPAVTHIDGSSRLHSVRPETNPRYACLIDAFRELTGVPMLLNTSFSADETLVRSPEEALDCFFGTRMDMLVLGDFVLERREARQKADSRSHAVAD